MLFFFFCKHVSKTHTAQLLKYSFIIFKAASFIHFSFLKFKIHGDIIVLILKCILKIKIKKKLSSLITLLFDDYSI